MSTRESIIDRTKETARSALNQISNIKAAHPIIFGAAIGIVAAIVIARKRKKKMIVIG